MNKTYDPEQIESSCCLLWQNENLFSSSVNSSSDNAYCIMLPPPNVTGSLHIGHAFQDTIMDILARYHRSNGEQTLWQPGTDHAGIATQMVVERQLMQQNVSRHELGREKFVEKIWEWKQESGGTITSQMRRLGASVDWEKERFTMDEGLSDAVTKVFVELYNEGLIYRGKRLVNWDPVLTTAVSDLEVINVEEQGELFYVRYPFVDGDGFMLIATTRPETILADGALAISPEDERYKKYLGKEVCVPLTERIIPIISDEYVDKDFGTGCVKITPAHDFNDWQVGQRHDMEIINLMTKTAHMNENAPKKYQGMDRFVARKQIIKDLESVGLLEKIEPHTMKRPRGDRTNAVIEPYLTDQWFVKTQELAKPAIKAVKDKEIRFVPENWSKTYFNWMENIEDWCISRQIWWGHRIPAWYGTDGNIYVASSLSEAQEKAGADVVLKQDDDVLDTWFSSALWPFSTLGWPEKTKELERFYPTNVLVTGFDIIFFWVARMIMFGLKFTNQVPFKEVYITGLIRDSQGQKMSKSKGNVLDPIDLIQGISLEDLLVKRTSKMMQPAMAKKIEAQTKKEFADGIPAFGADAMRFTFTALASFGRDIKFDLKRVEGYRNFCNKLWNASRFLLLNISTKETDRSHSLSAADKWIVSRLQNTKIIVNRHMSNYRFDLIAKELYDFVWHDYCDWYLELSKSLLANEATKQGTEQTLIKVLKEILIILNPVIPFITEEIYQQFKNLSAKKTSIMLEKYPQVEKESINKDAEEEVQWLQKFILGVRKIRAEMNIPPNKLLPCFVQNFNQKDEKYLNKNLQVLIDIAKLENIQQLPEQQKAQESATALVADMLILIPLAGLVDKNQEIKRLSKEIDKLEKQRMQFTNSLNNKEFISKAPQQVIEQKTKKLELINNAIGDLTTQLTKISQL